MNLAALLCYRRLHGVQDTPRTRNGSYLLDSDALLNSKPLNNEQATLEQNLYRFLAATLVKEDMPILHHLIGFSDQYLARRIECQPGYKDALEKEKLQALVKPIKDLDEAETGTDDDDDWVMVLGETEKLE